MHRTRMVYRLPWLFSPALVCGPLLLLSGCEDSSKPKMMTPAATPADESQDSMQAHMKQMEERAKKQPRR